MSSMWRIVWTIPLLLVTASASAQYPAPPPAQPPAYSAPSIGYSFNDWRRLRQSSGYSFADYARFLVPNPNWPEDSKLRGWAERAMQPGENAGTVLAFFANEPPKTGNGFARLAEALATSGRAAESLAAARNAWASDDLGDRDEQAIWARYGGSFTAEDHDRRVDALLFAKKADDAARFYSLTTPGRRAAFAARIAMQRDSSDADRLYQGAMSMVTSDAGLMMDRARWLRANNYEQAARQLAARPHNFIYRPADPERFYDMLLLLAGGAAQDRQWETVYNIGRHLRDALPPGADISQQPYGVRDNYTSLAWLAGTTALDRLRRPSAAVAMFDAYSQGGRSLQVETKGLYWAGRAALAAGLVQEANGYFERAAAYPELFYGQLALERLGRSVSPPQPSVVQYAATPAQRSAFYNKRLVQAVRMLQRGGSAEERALFVRALAESLDNDVDRGLAVELAQQVGRQDLAVWVARAARNDGTMFYVRQGYPSLSASLSGRLWSLAHGISRQESSFDPYAVSHAGARGMMQLMPGTAREQAGKMGVGYDGTRLYTDANYNVMIGSAYFERLLNMWDGNVPLAVASYNAGYGNVRKWVNAYGDPRGRVDVLKWIEAIPFTETKGYVQRVIENTVVYDSMRGASQQQTALHVSRYLGKSQPG
ncbi:MAG TPA: lytic transglycosylase domain-containing protein [Sphingomicrobium sp.]